MNVHFQKGAFLGMMVGMVLAGGGIAWGIQLSNSSTDGAGLTWHVFSNPDYTGGGENNAPPSWLILNDVTGPTNKLADLSIPKAVLWNYRGSDFGSPISQNVRLTCIGDGALKNRSSIHTVTIPFSVTNIIVPCFSGCTNLTSITVNNLPTDADYTSVDGILYGCKDYRQIPSTLVKYPEGKTGNYFEVPSTVTVLKKGCLRNTQLAAVRFTGDKPDCSSSAFMNSQFVGYCPANWGFNWGELWNGISMYPIPSSAVLSNGISYQYEIRDAIAWCYTLTNGGAKVTRGSLVPPALRGRVAIPETLGGYPVTEVENDAVTECPLVTGATVPVGVTNVDCHAFASNLFDTATVPGVGLVDGWVMEGQRAEGYVDLTGMRGIASGGVFAGNSNAFSVKLPEGFPHVPEKLFSQCIGLKTVVLPDDVTSIGVFAFEQCIKLTEIKLPEGLKDVGSGAFSGAGLTRLTVPDSVTNAGMWAFDCESLEHVTIGDGLKDLSAFHFSERNSLHSVDIGNGVINIERQAFQGCTGLESMTIGNGVVSMGGGAFSDCTGLKAVHIHDLRAWLGIGFSGSEANPLYHAGHLYLDGKEVTDLVVPDGVESVQDYAFVRCTGLKSAVFPDSVRSLGIGAFSACSNLTSLTLGAGVTDILERVSFAGCTGLEEFQVVEGNPAYASDKGVLYSKDRETLLWCPCAKSGTYSVPAGTKKLDDISFEDCEALTAVELPEGLETIGFRAFFNCTGLTRLAIPSGTKKLGNSAFENCGALTAVELPEGLETIGYYAFFNCASLLRLEIPASVGVVTDVAQDLGGAVNGCVALEAIEVAAGNPVYKSEDGVLFRKDGQSLIRYPEGKGGEYAVPEGTARILQGAFLNCASLQAVALPTGVVSIAKWAFSGCTGLSSISVPEGVTSIGASAFSECTGLKKVSLPEGLVGVSAEAFEGCGALKSLVLPAKTKTVGTDAFAGSGLKWIVVPDSLSAKTGSWGLPEGCEVIPWSEWATRRTAEGVPYEWLYQNGGAEVAEEEGWVAAANAEAENGRKMWECYVAGLSTTDQEDNLKVAVSFEDGALKVESMGGKRAGRTYWTEGKKNLANTDENWTKLKEGEDWTAEGWRFFRLGVELAE